MSVLLVCAAVVASYLAGRARPARALSDWAWTQIRVRRVTRSSWRWWAAQPIFACELIALLSLRPIDAIRNWRTRNDPPPPRSPAIRLLGEDQ